MDRRGPHAARCDGLDGRVARLPARLLADALRGLGQRGPGRRGHAALGSGPLRGAGPARGRLGLRAVHRPPPGAGRGAADRLERLAPLLVPERARLHAGPVPLAGRRRLLPARADRGPPPGPAARFPARRRRGLRAPLRGAAAGRLLARSDRARAARSAPRARVAAAHLGPRRGALRRRRRRLGDARPRRTTPTPRATPTGSRAGCTWGSRRGSTSRPGSARGPWSGRSRPCAGKSPSSAWPARWSRPCC